MFIAHRGNGKHKYYPNTEEAIINVLNENVSGVEFDIRMTSDNKFVVSHDPIIEGNIISFSKLKKLKKLKKNKISTLSEVLDKIRTDKKILIEIKSEIDDYKLLVKKLYNIIKKYNLNIYICSFNKKIIDDMNKLFNNVGLIIGYYINNDFLINKYKYNIVHYNYRNRVDNNKETFIWTINDKKKLNQINKNNFIITDKYYLFE